MVYKLMEKMHANLSFCIICTHACIQNCNTICYEDAYIHASVSHDCGIYNDIIACRCCIYIYSLFTAHTLCVYIILHKVAEHSSTVMSIKRQDGTPRSRIFTYVYSYGGLPEVTALYG